MSPYPLEVDPNEDTPVFDWEAEVAKVFHGTGDKAARHRRMEP